MESIYCVGDRVLIRDDLTVKGFLYEDSTFNKLRLVPQMMEFRGLEATIDKVCMMHEGWGVCYRIAEDKHRWLWAADMFDGLITDSSELAVDFDSIFYGGIWHEYV